MTLSSHSMHLPVGFYKFVWSSVTVSRSLPGLLCYALASKQGLFFPPHFPEPPVPLSVHLRGRNVVFLVSSVPSVNCCEVAFVVSRLPWKLLHWWRWWQPSRTKQNKTENVWILGSGSAISYFSACGEGISGVLGSLLLAYKMRLFSRSHCVNSRVKACQMVLEGKCGLHLVGKEEGMACVAPSFLLSLGINRVESMPGVKKALLKRPLKEARPTQS